MSSNGGSRNRIGYSSIIIAILLLSSIASSTYGAFPVLPNKKVQYIFIVDEDGVGNITIRYIDSGGIIGEGWIMIPKNLSLDIRVLEGKIVSSHLGPAVYNGQEYIFYNNYSFIYRITGDFILEINYIFNLSSLVVEPYAFFLSPQIGFSSDAKGEVYIYLPKESEVDSYIVYELSQGSVSFELKESEQFNIIYLNQINNIDRVAIEYEVTYLGAYTNLTLNNFYIYTPNRYIGLAKKILYLYNYSYPKFHELFGFELSKKIEVILFPPKYSDFIAGIAGFVPFESGTLGAINLNMIYFRTLKGNIEITAIHELAHHFIWAMGVDPGTLWIHEGLATYLSIEIGDYLGYSTVAEEYRETYNMLVAQLDSLGFIQGWGMEPIDTAYYYAAAYYIFDDIGERYGGLDFYKELFRRLSEYESIDTYIFVSVLDSLVPDDMYDYFKKTGFYIEATVNIESIKTEVEDILDSLPDWIFPFNLIIYSLYLSSLLATGRHLYTAAEHLMQTAKLMGESINILAYSAIIIYFISIVVVSLYVYIKKKGY